MIARYVGLAVWPRSLVVDYGLPRSLAIGDVVPQALLLLLLLGGHGCSRSCAGRRSDFSGRCFS